VVRAVPAPSATHEEGDGEGNPDATPVPTEVAKAAAAPAQPEEHQQTVEVEDAGEVRPPVTTRAWEEGDQAEEQMTSAVPVVADGSGSEMEPGEPDELELADDERESGEEEEGDARNTIPDRAKLKLLTQYMYLVQLYLLVVVIILVYQAWKNDNSPELNVVLEVLNLVVMIGLIITFRLRASNPYFVLTDYDEFDGDEGGIGINGGVAVEMSKFSSSRSRVVGTAGRSPGGLVRRGGLWLGGVWLGAAWWGHPPIIDEIRLDSRLPPIALPQHGNSSSPARCSHSVLQCVLLWMLSHVGCRWAR